MCDASCVKLHGVPLQACELAPLSQVLWRMGDSKLLPFTDKATEALTRQGPQSAVSGIDPMILTPSPFFPCVTMALIRGPDAVCLCTPGLAGVLGPSSAHGLGLGVSDEESAQAGVCTSTISLGYALSS